MKKHTIFNNYDDVDECITEDLWECAYDELRDFFGNGHFILVGTVGRWDGVHECGTTFCGFNRMWGIAVEDCHSVHLWDEGGHFYIEAAHHDGTNRYEIKRLTEKGYNYIIEWTCDYSDKRTEREIYNLVFNNTSMARLPHYAKHVFGVGW